MKRARLTQTERLAEAITQVCRGPVWHGPALMELLDDVSEIHAAAHPIRGAHSIWELAVHVAFWAETALARLDGMPQGTPTVEDDWQSGRSTSAEDWLAARQRLVAAHETLAARVARLDDAALLARLPGREDTALPLLHGVIEHGAYHGGQIAILKKALES